MPRTTSDHVPVMGGTEWILLFVLAILWGSSFFFNGIGARELPALTFVWLRVAVASAALLVTLRFSGLTMPPGRVWLSFFGMGILNNVLPFVLIVWGQHRIASGLAAILNATTPIFTVLVAHVLTHDEKLNLWKGLGVLIGFGGAVIVIGPNALLGFGGPIVPQLACLGAALSYAFAGVFGRRFKAMGIAPITTATGQVCASTITLLPIMLLIDRPWTLPMPHAATWGAVGGIGLLSTALGYVIYFRILAVAGATNLLLVTFLIPLTAILLGAAVLHESLLPQHLAGMLVIGLALASIDGRLPRKLRRPFLISSGL